MDRSRERPEIALSFDTPEGRALRPRQRCASVIAGTRRCWLLVEIRYRADPSAPEGRCTVEKRASRHRLSANSDVGVTPTPNNSDLRNFIVCYNRSCEDYGRKRDPRESCACKKRSMREPLFMRDYELGPDSA